MLESNSANYPKCSIIIRAYNEGHHLKKLLEGIVQQNIKEIEIILVDSGSTDSTIDIARKYPVQILTIDPEEFTFGRSLNRGIDEAKGEFVIIVSAHAYPVYPDWLENLLVPFADKKVALTYGKQRSLSSGKFSEAQFFKQWFPERSNYKQNHPFCNNANAAIRRELWNDNPYDESLSGLEDVAWAKWAIESDHYLAYAADAEIIHIHNETIIQIYNRYKREAIAFKQLFPHEVFRFRTFLRLYISNVFNDFIQGIKEHVFLRNIWSVLWFRFAQFWGTYRGYRHSGPLTEKLRWVFYYPPEDRSDTAPSRNVAPIEYDVRMKEMD